MQRHLTYLIFAGIVFASCKKDKTSKTFGSNTSISGPWKWVLQTDAKAINGIPFDTLTPQSTGYTEFLNMYADSSWAQVRNGQTLNSGIYKFVDLYTPAWPVHTLDFVHNGVDSLVNHSISNDTLYTSNVEFAGTYTVRIYVK